MRKHLASLYYATENCLESVAVEFFSKSLISRDVKKLPSFSKIENEFVASLFFCEEDTTKLEEKCRDFVHCLAKASGPAKDAAVALAEDWEHEVMNKHSLKWSLKIDIETNTDLSLPLEILLSSDDEVPQKMQYLREKCRSLVMDIKAYYVDCKQYKVEDLASYLIEDAVIPLEKPIADCKNFASLFESVRAQTDYDFFNFELIEDLAKEFPLSDELQLELDQYVQELEQFKKSAALQQIKDAIKRVPLPHEASKLHCKIVIKLSGSWRKNTVKSLKKLIRYLFEHDAKRAQLIEIDEGSIIVTFLALSRAQSLIDKVQNKIQFVQYLGIYHIMINNEVIIDREEDINFTFEDSLLYAINHIGSDAEYERVALLLIELKIELNYQNTDGQTPLMLASVGGHINIFNSLLQNGADPVVQLPSNKGYIGLNCLACTALSQHIYQSIGGERIIPQDDTSVEDILEMAVKERGVSNHFYEPFMHTIKNNLKEKFQWLQECFHALNGNFVDVATNILTSKALVAEAKQKFQSYIKEDVNCENAHQLVQLLQFHYSCLNVDLLTIACTITEPIKEQVEEYNTNLKMFKDTTSLLELAMMTKGMQYPDGVSCSKLILRLNKSWCSRTITELNKIENFYLLSTLSFLNLIETYYDASSCTCTYLLPQLSQTESLMAAVFEQKVSLYAIGVFEVMIDDIPIMIEDEDSSFTFESALQEAHRTNNENVLFFLLELNITLPLENDNTDHMIASRRGDFMTVQFLLSKDPDIYIQNNDGVTALMDASGKGHHQVVELLLSKDPDINIQNNDGWTALMYASHYGHHQVVELLLSKDPDINIQNNNGWTALMFASVNGHHQVVELLLSKDPDINIQNNDRVTALMYASRYGHHQVVELLLSKDPDINIQNIDGVTALMFASVNGHHQVVELLLSKDPDINIQDNDGWIALMHASRYEHHQVVELLLSKYPDNIGVTALMFASGNGYYQVVELLLSKDSDINIQNNDRETALMFASVNGHHQVVELLLSKNPDINIKNNNGLTALMFASVNGHHQVVELLLSKNPDINIKNNNGLTALMFASVNGHHQVVELLLSKNPDINIKNNNGLTALMFASINGHHQVVELLLSKNPDINIKTNDGVTALIYASINGHHQVVKLLLSKDPDINIQANAGVTALMYASVDGHYQVVELLLSKDPNINNQDNDGVTALMHASRYGHHQVVELLLSKDPDINIKNNNGVTALMFASANGHHQAVKLLLSKDPEINIQDNNGVTALMLASANGHHQVVELLLSKDPDINIKNNDGETALMYASVNGHHQVVELLLSKDPDINIQNNNGWTALMLVSSYGHHQVVEILLSKDPDINIKTNNGVTALMIASGNGHHQVVELLLSKDPDINIQNNAGVSAFTLTLYFNKHTLSNYIKILELLLNSHPNHIHTIKNVEIHSLSLAALFNNFDAVTILMEKCDITPEHIISAFTWACNAGHSSLMIQLSEKITTLSNNERKLLVAAAEGDLGTLISMIFEVGMSPDTPLVAGITPLMIAATSGHTELVDALIQAGADVNKRNDKRVNALDIVNVLVIVFDDRSDIKELLITSTPAVEPDPVSNNDETTNSTDPVSNNDETTNSTDPVLNNDETTNKKLSTVTEIQTLMLVMIYLFTKTIQELKVPHGITDKPYSAMPSRNMLQLACK